MIQLFCLVDYYNVAPLRKGVKVTYEDHKSAVDSLVAALLQAAQLLEPQPTELHVRLYGGWFSSLTDSTTPDRDCLGAIARRYFPTRRRTRVFLEPADSLLALPNEFLPHTIRAWQGFMPFDLADIASTCPLGKAQCAAIELGEWKRGRCPKIGICGVQSRDVVATRRQKLVDTAIVADTIHISSRPECWVAPVSNDDDIIPGIITAKQWSERTFLIRLNRRERCIYDAILNRNKIRICNLET